MNTQSSFDSTLPTGSSLYYALLYSTPVQRQAVAVVNTFIQELRLIVKNVTEVSVAKAKLNWWRTEINQTYKGHPQHPLSTQLLGIIKEFDLPEIEFQHLIQSTLIEIDYQFSNQIEKERYYRNGMGAKLYLISCITSRTKPPEAFINHLAFSLQSIHEIQFVGKDQKRTQHYFGNYDSLQMINILKAHSEFAKVHFNQALKSLNANERYQQLSLIILGNIKNALLDEIIRSNFNVLQQRISLTPLKKLWVTWRTKALEKKRFKQIK